MRGAGHVQRAAAGCVPRHPGRRGEEEDGKKRRIDLFERREPAVMVCLVVWTDHGRGAAEGALLSRGWWGECVEGLEYGSEDKFCVEVVDCV
jgi:hypothetical protein